MHSGSTSTLAFFGIVAAMAISPGPATLFSLATGMQKGRQAALLGVAGINFATLLWFGIAIVSLNTIALVSPAIFRALRIVGIGYLFWLAYRTFMQGWKCDELYMKQSTRQNSFFEGFCVQVTNPNIFLFFTVVLPPFLDLQGSWQSKLIFIGAIYIALDILCMSIYGFGGAAVRRYVDNPRFKCSFYCGISLLLVAAAIMLMRNFYHSSY